jgi:DnaJ-class molecular chaperone
MPNYYEILGVSPQATADEIKKAYRAQAMQWHPDRNPGNEQAKARFQQINEAYETLGDPVKRQQHDAPPHMHGFPPGFHPFGPGNFDDMLRDIFGQAGGTNFRWHAQAPPPKNRDIQYTLHVSLEDAFNGKQMPVNIQFGTVNKTLNVTLPAGVESGYRIKFPGQGENTVPNAAAGDIYIQVHVQDHSRFQRIGSTLSMEITIDAIKACLGAEINVIGIDNKQMSIKISPGAQHGMSIVAGQHGMSVLGSKQRGDLIIMLKISVPTSITAEQRSLLEQFVSLNTGS